ncbi:MAG: ABC transporter ATP-binding protein, partial [Tidjanibacter sp.]|nr:ABC transporter ATP-binding protein [Tidjanibacter sp.]
VASLTMKEVAGQIAFVSTDDVRVQNLHVWDVVSLGRAPYTNWVGRLTAEDRAKVEESLRLVGMEQFAEASMDSLSDGERQRVMIARALAQDTPIILLDEPTAFLDLPNKYEICLLLRRLAHKEGKCILFSTHDLSIAIELCDTIAMIEGGEFRYGTAEMLIEEGAMQRLFESTQIEFDRERGNVRLKK